jgi:hypothetical protein
MGQLLGVFSEDQLREGIARGQFAATDLFWVVGAEMWRPLGELASQWMLDMMLVPPIPSSWGGVCAGDFEPAWESRREKGFFLAILQTMKSVLLKPNTTFTNLKRTGGVLAPLSYYLTLTVMILLVLIVVDMLFVGLGVAQILQSAIPVGHFTNSLATGLPPATTTSGILTSNQIPWFHNPISGLLIGFGSLLLIVYILVVFAVFFATHILIIFFQSALYHLCLKLLGGALHPFETTFRVCCYVRGSSCILLFVPVAGSLWSLYCQIAGLRAAHGTDWLRAILAVFLPVLICCGGIILCFSSFIAALGSSILSTHH